MDSLFLTESEDAIRRLDLRDAMDSQSRIERHHNPLQMSRVSIFRDGVVDGVGIAAREYQNYANAPHPLWRKVWLAVLGWLTLTRGTKGGRR